MHDGMHKEKINKCMNDVSHVISATFCGFRFSLFIRCSLFFRDTPALVAFLDMSLQAPSRWPSHMYDGIHTHADLHDTYMNLFTLTTKWNTQNKNLTLQCALIMNQKSLKKTCAINTLACYTSKN